MTKVLITGVAGYVGSILARMLLDNGHEVVGVDSLMYDNYFSIKSLKGHENYTFKMMDLRDKTSLAEINRLDYDVMVHLAAIVGDPACNLHAENAVKVNYDLTSELAELVAENERDLFLFASTCSVYGKGKEPLLTENSELNPVSLYGWSKVLAEKGLKRIEKERDLPVCVLRFSTAHGLSYRPRFDLVINYFALKAFRDKEILVFGGDQWRPFIHTRDMAKAIMLCVENPDAARGNTFNVGSDDENYTIRSVGEMVKEMAPETSIRLISEIQDERSYRVDFSKLEDELGFRQEYSIRDTIKETFSALENGYIGDPMNEAYYNNLRFKV
ncbi:NAD(P)-dependent oxidoreductase [Candidatus Bathyarchaeota archaeon]|nr:NAD(P)-dependent oxidoreductase [Candidatus Bathyarchaeota archaeon]